MIAALRALVAPVAYLLAAAWIWRAEQTGLTDRAAVAIVQMFMLWSFAAAWIADEHRKRQGPARRCRIHMNGWPRLRRWLTDGPLPEIETITIAREPRHDRLFGLVLNTPTSGHCETCGAKPDECCDTDAHMPASEWKERHGRRLIGERAAP